jgi:HlyD family secretion protein
LLVSGNIEAHESLVSFKTVQSRIVDLPFDEGQWVVAGTQLARLDDSDYQKQVDVDQAALTVQQKELASSFERLAAAKANVTNDEADLAQKTVDYSRSRELFQQGVIGAQTNDLATTAVKQSRATLVRDQANVRAAETDMEVAKASIEQARQTLQLANIMLGYTVLRAPFSGVVLVRQAELGEVMLPGSPVMTLADLDHIWLRGYISETDLERVRWGQPATITTDSYRGKTFHGRVSFIASDAEFTPKSVETHKERVTLVYRIKIDIENPLHELKPGMPADALIDLAAPAQQRPTQIHVQ